MSEALLCWRCGAALVDYPLPLGREDVCRQCRADLHVCRMCRFHDPSVAKQCREPIAEEVNNKERANFCGYLQPKSGAFKAKDADAAQRARAELNELFGQAQGAGSAMEDEVSRARRSLDALFRRPEDKE